MIFAMMVTTGPMVMTMMTSVMTSMMTSMMASMMTIATAARTATDEEQHRGRESRVQQAQVKFETPYPLPVLINTVFLPIHQRWVWTIVSRSARKDVRLDRSQKVSAISSYLRQFIIIMIHSRLLFIFRLIISIICRSAGDMWSWLPQMPTNERLPRSEDSLLEVWVLHNCWL